MRLPLLAALAAASLVCDASARPRAVELRDGDLVFQMSRSRQSTAVARATLSRLTHMGVESWRHRGDGGRVWVKRLRDASAVLTPEVVARMRALGQIWLGRRYDLQFRWDDERLYCSELAYKLYERGAGVQIGKVQRAGEIAAFSTARGEPELHCAGSRSRSGLQVSPGSTCRSFTERAPNT